MVCSIKKKAVNEFEIDIAREIEVIHVEAGEVRVINKNCFCTLRAEETIIIAPNDSYILRDISGDSVIINVRLDQKSFMSESSFSGTKLETGLISDPDISRYLNEIYEESSNKKLSREKLNESISGLIDSFKANLYYNNLENSLLDEKKFDSYEQYDLILRVMEYVQEMAPDESFRLSDLGDVFNISYSYLSKVFKEKSGVCLNEYLTRYRFQIACDLLLQTNKMISQVAYESGFGSVRNLNRTFQKYLGITPTEFKGEEIIFNIS